MGKRYPKGVTDRTDIMDNFNYPKSVDTRVKNMDNKGYTKKEPGRSKVLDNFYLWVNGKNSLTNYFYYLKRDVENKIGVLQERFNQIRIKKVKGRVFYYWYEGEGKYKYAGNKDWLVIETARKDKKIKDYWASFEKSKKEFKEYITGEIKGHLIVKNELFTLTKQVKEYAKTWDFFKISKVLGIIESYPSRSLDHVQLLDNSKGDSDG